MGLHVIGHLAQLENIATVDEVSNTFPYAKNQNPPVGRMSEGRPVYFHLLENIEHQTSDWVISSEFGLQVASRHIVSTVADFVHA